LKFYGFNGVASENETALACSEVWQNKDESMESRTSIRRVHEWSRSKGGGEMALLYAGIDSSTQGTKIVLLDLERTEVVYVDSVNYDSDLPAYQTHNGVVGGAENGVSESDPQMWLDALNLLFDRMKKKNLPFGEIRAISVSGQQHGLVALDADGDLTRSRSKLWNDFSTGKECELLTQAAGGADRMIEEVGNSQRTGYTAAKILHLVRHEPDAYRRTATLFLVHNYINWYLTGGKQGGVRVMEPGDTSGMALWHPKKRTWSRKVVESIAADLQQKLPPLQPSDRLIGKIGKHLVDAYGFSPACQIDAGSGDNMYGAVGTGNVVPGIVTISLGTSGTAYTFMREAFIDPSGEIAAFCDSTGHHLPLLCVSNLANGYNAVLQQYKLSHQAFVDLVEQEPPANRGRVLIPWYMGERTPDVPQAAPLYFGFDLDEFQPAVLCRAVLEGHVLNLYDGFRRMPVKSDEIRLTGGLAKSRAWVQTIADIFDCAAVPVEGEGAALGAALHAAWAHGKTTKPDLDLAQLVQPFVVLDESKRCTPRSQYRSDYTRLRALFSALSARIRGKNGEDPFALRAALLGGDRKF